MDSPHFDSMFALTIGPLSMPARAAMDQCDRLNIRYVQWSANYPGMRPRDLDGSARRDLLASLRRRTLAPAGIDLWIPLDHFTENEHSERAAEALLATIILAEDLGGIPISTAFPANDSTQHILDVIQSEAHRRGVVIADHNTKATPQSLPALKIGIDPAAVIACGDNPSSAVVDAGRNCKSARISDLLTSGTRGPIGRPDGQLDVQAYRAALAAIEYDQPVVVDCRGWIDHWNGIRQSLHTWGNAAPVF